MVASKTIKTTLITATILLILGIILGAFAAHGLKGKLIPEKLASFETGVRYQIYTGFSLFIIAFSAHIFQFSIKTSFRLMLLGVIAFSGSIYGLALNEILNLGISKILGPITPIGGLLLILGWIIFLREILKIKVKS
jgi:uncharacterized membrane protein YgdD (TMEM256/DUF423 family)